MRKIIFTAILSIFAGAAFGAADMSGRVAAEGGFVDVDLPIVSYHLDKDRSLELTATGLIEGREVGFELRLDSKGDSRSGGKGFIRSLGHDSDAFVELLARKYGMHANMLKMVPEVPMAVLVLAEEPGATGMGPIKMKIFFHADGGPDYAEAFLNMDMEKKTLEFHDKDPEYHAGILASLSGGK